MMVDGVLVKRMKFYYHEMENGESVLKSMTAIGRFCHRASDENVREASKIIANLKGIDIVRFTVLTEETI